MPTTAIVWGSIGAQVRDSPFHTLALQRFIGILTLALSRKFFFKMVLILVVMCDSCSLQDKDSLGGTVPQFQTSFESPSPDCFETVG